ncbi:hypothetical protein HYV22_03145 [Candidatus Gottesmanbacteria bacterium]|nr:hypothetical protein [Candidatus Gottesmanbacteria bacterium]
MDFAEELAERSKWLVFRIWTKEAALEDLKEEIEVLKQLKCNYDAVLLAERERSKYPDLDISSPLVSSCNRAHI